MNSDSASGWSHPSPDYLAGARDMRERCKRVSVRVNLANSDQYLKGFGDGAEAFRSAVAALPLASGGAPRWRHKARGSAYEVIGSAQVQVDDALTDYEVVTVYRDEEGELWVRRRAEFNTRFERIAPGGDTKSDGGVEGHASGTAPTGNLVAVTNAAKHGQSAPVFGAGQRRKLAPNEPLCTEDRPAELAGIKPGPSDPTQPTTDKSAPSAPKAEPVAWADPEQFWHWYHGSRNGADLKRFEFPRAIALYTAPPAPDREAVARIIAGDDWGASNISVTSRMRYARTTARLKADVILALMGGR